MTSKPPNYEEMEHSISDFLKDCKSIRADRQKDYNFHFMDNYNKYGLKGFLINDGEITARLEQIEKKINGTTGYIDKEKSLRNILYDGINYRLLLLFWLNREKFQNKITDIYPNNSYQFICMAPYNTTDTRKTNLLLPTMDEAIKSAREYVEDIVTHLNFDGISVGQHVDLLPNLYGIFMGDRFSWHFAVELTTTEGKLNGISWVTVL